MGPLVHVILPARRRLRGLVARAFVRPHRPQKSDARWRGLFCGHLFGDFTRPQHQAIFAAALFTGHGLDRDFRRGLCRHPRNL